MDALALLGPTAVGKSSLALDLAERLGGEIISVDSRQAYKHLDIGTSKPTEEERKRVRHHLIDILELDKKNNAENFARLSKETISEIISRRSLPILVGGSGLYFQAVFNGFFDIDLDQEDRDDFSDSVSRRDTPELYNRLVLADPESGKRIHPNDRYRIVRALEVYTLTGIPLSEHFKRQKSSTGDPEIDFLKLGLHIPREKLHERINGRTRMMLEAGWIEEVESILRGGADAEWPGLKSLGYPEVISYIHGKIGREELIETISRLTRQYAKRQMTWFRKEKDVTWFRADDKNLTGLVLDWIDRAGGR